MPEIKKISTPRPDDITPLDINQDAHHSHIMPVNPAQDMPAVLDLIELGFKDELDPQGWKMLHQMRRIYRPGLLSYVLPATPLNTSGFIWVEDGQIVGNLSLRHAMPRSTQGRMIGNVVVHPDYRGQGIGRALMEEAIEADDRIEADYTFRSWSDVEKKALKEGIK